MQISSVLSPPEKLAELKAMPVWNG